MIKKAEIINRPISGEYNEKIYDIKSSWNSQEWTWIRFTDDDCDDWCGEFRGFPKDVAISEKHNSVLVLTTDYLYQLDRTTGEIIEYQERTEYHQLTATPSGDYILASYYGIDLVKTSIKEEETITLPIHADNIEFKGWRDDKLIIFCEEFLHWNKHFQLELDSDTFEIEVKNAI